MDKLIVTRSIQIDKSSLLDDIDTVIANLKRIKEDNPGKQLRVQEMWSGYEDNWFGIRYDELETDEEYTERIQKENREAKLRAEELKKEQVRSKKLKQLKQLKEELGIYY